jgi:hypothetical protein
MAGHKVSLARAAKCFRAGFLVARLTWPHGQRMVDSHVRNARSEGCKPQSGPIADTNPAWVGQFMSLFFGPSPLVLLT